MNNPKNQMSPDDCKMAFPKKAWFEPERSKTGKAECPESALQSYVNDALALRHWQYLRFPDGLLGWMKRNAPPWVQAVFYRQVGGRLPDNLIMIPLGNGYFFSCKLELKTQDSKGRAVGKTHGKQKHFAESEEWKICRSPEAIETALKEIEIKAEMLKKSLCFDDGK